MFPSLSFYLSFSPPLSLKSINISLGEDLKKEKTQSVFREEAYTVALLSPFSHLSVCFYVEAQGAQSKAEPLFHDVDIAAHL